MGIDPSQFGRLAARAALDFKPVLPDAYAAGRALALHKSYECVVH